MNCKYRTSYIGQLQSGCYSCNVYKCNKYNIHCTVGQPRVQEGKLYNRKGKEIGIYFKDHRICKECIEKNEQVP